jgi:RecA/RadA recombinase
MSVDLKFIESITSKIEGAASGVDAGVEKWLDSGNYALNKIISGSYFNGLPFGRTVEVFGDPSTAKSLLSYRWIASVQKIGGIAVLDDIEESYTESFGRMLGIDNKSLILLKSLTVEEHFEKIFLGWKDEDGKAKPSIIELIQKDHPDCPILICLDSIAQLSTRHEQKVKLETVDMSKAKVLRAALKLMSAYLRNGDIIYAANNHVTFKVGMMFGNPRTTPGGTAMPFTASVRLEMSKGTKIDDPDNPKRIIGETFHAKGAKNRVAFPFQETILDIYFDKGLDPYSGLLESVITNKIATPSINPTTGAEKRGFIDIFGEQIRKSDFIEYIKKNLDKLKTAKPFVEPAKVDAVETPKKEKNKSEKA